jgi:hypothetical protein
MFPKCLGDRIILNVSGLSKPEMVTGRQHREKRCRAVGSARLGLREELTADRVAQDVAMAAKRIGFLRDSEFLGCSGTPWRVT